MMVMTSELRLQVGTQSQFDTGVTPTVMMRGFEEFRITPNHDIVLLPDMTNALAGGDTAVVKSVAGQANGQGWLSYEDICYLFDNLFGQATPTGTGPYVRAYAAPLNTAPTPRILSMTYGDSVVGAQQLVGALLTSLTLRFEAAAEGRFTSDFIGAKIQADTLESLAKRTVNPIVSSHLTGIKWDTWAGTMGSTALTNCYVRFIEFTFTPDRVSRFCFGSLSAGSYRERPWDATLAMGLEFNSTTKADVDAALAGTLTQKQVQLDLADSTRALQLQFAGTLTEPPEVFDDDDGVVTANVTLQRTYHPTFANWFKATVTNGVQTLA